MKNSRAKNASKNVIFVFFSQITKALLLFINRTIFAKVLGPEYLGINGLFSNILTILSLADLGMTSAMMYSLYEPLANNNKDKIIKYLNHFKKIYNYIALIVAIIGLSIIPFIKYIINLPNNIPNINFYYIILLTNTVLSYLFVYKTTLLEADQKMFIINKYDIFFQIILFVTQIFILLFTKNFAFYLLSNVLCTFLCNIFKVKHTNKIYPYLNSNLQLNKKEKKAVYSNIKSLFFYKLGGIIQSNTDNILISIFVGTITVGYYSNYSLIVLQITTFITLIFNSIKSSVGNFNIEKNNSEKYSLFEILEVYNFWIVGFCALIFLTILPIFIEICFGKDYLLPKSFLIFFVLNFYTSNIRQTLWIFRETTGIFEKTKFITLITAIVNIFLSILLGKKLGLIGIVSATVISRMIYAWWKEPIIIYNNIFNMTSKKYFKNYILRLLAILVLYKITNYIFSFIVINNLFLLLVSKIIFVTTISILALYVTYKNSDAYKYILVKLKGEYK